MPQLLNLTFWFIQRLQQSDFECMFLIFPRYDMLAPYQILVVVSHIPFDAYVISKRRGSYLYQSPLRTQYLPPQLTNNWRPIFTKMNCPPWVFEVVAPLIPQLVSSQRFHPSNIKLLSTYKSGQSKKCISQRDVLLSNAFIFLQILMIVSSRDA